MRRVAPIIPLAVLLVALSPVAAQTVRRPVGMQRGSYSVAYRRRGIRITLRFAARSFPRHALIAVTDTITNISNRHLATIEPFDSAHSGPYRWPIVSLESVNAHGQGAQPAPPVPIMIPRCPAPPASRLPIGKSRVEHQLIVLWTTRLVAPARLYNVVHRGYWGFDLKGPTVRFRLYRAAASTASITGRRGSIGPSIPCAPRRDGTSQPAGSTVRSRLWCTPDRDVDSSDASPSTRCSQDEVGYHWRMVHHVVNHGLANYTFALWRYG